MNKKTTPLSLSFLLAVFVFSLSFDRRAQAQILDPIVKEGQVIVNTIYDTSKWVLRVPYKLAFPLLARMKLKSMVENLSLQREVHKRVIARIESKGLIDEIIPFLSAVKDLYIPTGRFKSNENFDTYLRKQFKPTSTIPGIEHTMFQWKTKNENPETSRGFGLNDYLVSQLVYLYDAVYLQGKDPKAKLGNRLACEQEKTDADFSILVDRAMPITKNILEYVAGLLPDGHEYKDVIIKTAREHHRLQTITVSLVEFIDQQVCKHYRMFATSIFRQDQLRKWLRSKLKQERKGNGSGELWTYLNYANDHRRYAMHVVVDGLQGHLIEALATGNGKNTFIKKIMHDQRNAKKFAPNGQTSKTIAEVLKEEGKPPHLNHDFIKHFAKLGFTNDHYLPFFRDLYKDQTNGIVITGISTTPTISVRNLPIAMTGAPVAGMGATGLPNFHFVDRSFVYAGDHRGRPYYFFGNDALQLQELTRKAGMKTLFERLSQLTSFNCDGQFDRGANNSVDGFVNLAVGETIRDFGDVICVSELERRAANEKILRKKRESLLDLRKIMTAQHQFWEWYDLWGKRSARVLAERLIDEIAELEQDAFPEYLLYYSPWPDHFAHFKGPFSDEILSPSGELNRLDYWLRRYTEIYKKAGIYKHTLFGMAGDHGLTPVYHFLNPELVVFGEMRKRGVDFKVIKISSDEGEGPKLNSRLDPPSMKGIDAVVASTAGGNYMLDLFLDQGDGFTKQPLYHDLLAVKPLKYQKRAAFKPVNLIAEIYTRLSQSLDYLVVREKACDVKGGVVRIIGNRYGKRVDGLIERRERRIFYKITGADLLETNRLLSYGRLTENEKQQHATLYRQCHSRKSGSKTGAVYNDSATWCTERGWRTLASFTDRPDAVVQLAHIYDIGLAGTINLFPKQGIGYNSKVPGRHAGEHFHEKDAFVGLWGMPVKRTAKQGRIRTAVNGSMPTAIYEYLSGVRTVEGEDGWGYPSLGEAILGSH
ncbi:MAG: alkaline phosphatase family protein [Gammaproteobacteria bacterium]|nr:MAG: alkaline phosphatase family protein [Gammaproteobacteria bacterium]